MLGIAIGDAFGAGYENLSRSEVQEALNMTQYDCYPFESGHKPGHYTDDTQMSIAVAKTLYGMCFDRRNLTHSFLEEYKSNNIIGYSRGFLSILEASKSPEDFINNVVHTERNGAVMRAVPIGVLQDIKKVVENSVINAQISHNTDSAITASVAIALASHYFFYNLGQPSEVIEFCIDNMGGFNPESLEYLAEVSKMGELKPEILFGEENKDHGVPIHGLKTAGAVLYLLTRYSHDGMETLKQAVLLLGDTDTTSSIALGIVQSASEGGLDDFLQDDLQNGDYGKDYIRRIGTRLATILPMEVRSIKRLNYPGSRQSMIVQTLDGLLEILDPIYLTQVMKQLFDQIDYKPTDIILAVDASGYIPAVAASIVTGLKLGASKKADLEISNRIEFYEPGTPNPNVFMYSIPDNSRVIIVDDEIMSGNTAYNAAKALMENGHKVLATVVPVESTRHNSREKLSSKGISLISHTKHDFS